MAPLRVSTHGWESTQARESTPGQYQHIASIDIWPVSTQGRSNQRGPRINTGAAQHMAIVSTGQYQHRAGINTGLYQHRDSINTGQRWRCSGVAIMLMSGIWQQTPPRRSVSDSSLTGSSPSINSGTEMRRGEVRCCPGLRMST